MNTQIKYRVCEERNVAAAFEHFRPRRRPLRVAALLLTDHLSRSWRTSALLAAFPARPHRGLDQVRVGGETLRVATSSRTFSGRR